jgi:competence protein ComEC
VLGGPAAGDAAALGRAALGLPLLLPVLLWQAPRPAPGEFELLAADVGQGNAVLVRTAGHTLVYDAGPALRPESDAGQRVLVPLLRALGERSTLLVLSHRDSDHTGGAAGGAAHAAGARLLSSLEPAHPCRRCAHHAAASPASAGTGTAWLRGAASAGGRLRRRGGGPTRPAACCASATGARRRCWRATSKGRRKLALLEPGRCGRPTCCWCRTMAARPRPATPSWTRCAPLALVQAGYRNRFGHPAPPVVARYPARDIAVCAPPLRRGAGGVGRPARCAASARARRYWHHGGVPAPD